MSRSVSNLGSSLGVAIAGTVIVVSLASAPNAGYALALVVLVVFSAVGLIAAITLPSEPVVAPAAAQPELAT